MENREIIKEMFDRLLALKKEEIDRIYDMKTLEEDIKFDYASAKGFKKKDESIDTGRVKIGLVKDAIKIKYLEEKNRIEEKYNLLMEYIDDLENNNFNSDLVDSYINKIEELAGIKSDFKLTKDEYGGTLDKDVIKNVDKLVKMIGNEYKEEKDRKWKESIGKPVIEKEEENSEMIKEIAKILNIDL